MEVPVVPRGMAELAVTAAVVLMGISLPSMAVLAGAAVTAVPVGSSQAMAVPAALAVAAAMVQTAQLGHLVCLPEQTVPTAVMPAMAVLAVAAVTEA